MPPTDSSLKNGAGNLAWYFWKIANPRAWPVDVEISFVVRIPLTDQATNGNSFSAMVSTNLIYSFLMSGFCSKWKIKDKLPTEFFSLTLKAQIKTKENKTLREHTARLLFHRCHLNLWQFPGPGSALPSRGRHCSQSHLHSPRAGLRCSQNLGREASPVTQTVVCYGSRDGLHLSPCELFLDKKQDEKLELEFFEAETTLWDPEVFGDVPLSISWH